MCPGVWVAELVYPSVSIPVLCLFHTSVRWMTGDPFPWLFCVHMAVCLWVCKHTRVCVHVCPCVSLVFPPAPPALLAPCLGSLERAVGPINR